MLRAALLAAALTATPGTADTGAVVVGTTSAPRSVTLRNAGEGAVALQAFTLAGDAAGEFAAQAVGCPPVLAPGAACDVAVTFTPHSGGERRATLTVATDAGPTEISVTGTGTEPAAPAQPPQPVQVLFPLAPSTSLRVGDLRAPRRLRRGRPLRVSFEVPAPAQVARVSLRRDGAVVQHGWLVRTGPTSVRFTAPLRPGLYVVRVQVGLSATVLGPPAFTRVRVVR